MKELEEMKVGGVIEPSTSDWVTPIVVVRKKDGGIRLYVDFRRLNSVSRMDAYPMPWIDELLDQIRGSIFG